MATCGLLRGKWAYFSGLARKEGVEPTCGAFRRPWRDPEARKTRVQQSEARRPLN